jgi:hypothetical protein
LIIVPAVAHFAAVTGGVVFLSYPVVFPTSLVALVRAIAILSVGRRRQSTWTQILFWSGLLIGFFVALVLFMVLTYLLQYADGHGAIFVITPIWALPSAAWFVSTVTLLVAHRKAQ